MYQAISAEPSDELSPTQNATPQITASARASQPRTRSTRRSRHMTKIAHIGAAYTTIGPKMNVRPAATPHIVALLVGSRILKMNPVILLGACAGAGTVTAALRAIQDEAESKLPVLGYTVPYAIGNILLTAWGPVIVVLTQ